MIFLRTLKASMLFAALASCLCSAAVRTAAAQDFPPQAITPVEANVPFTEETHPPLRLTPDQSQIITLNDEVGRVIVGNEIHLNVMMDAGKRIVVVPRVPGATFFTILGRDGKVLMQRYAIVASPKEKYIRIRQACAAQDGCMPVRMFYCPGMCHEMAIVGAGGVASSGATVPAAGGSGDGGKSNKKDSKDNDKKDSDKSDKSDNSDNSSSQDK